MRISIAMATYNGGRYLREQLDSFRTQTRGPDELIVCDDASTDDTLRILEDFRRVAPFRVDIFRNPENLGYIRNFAGALARCTGDIVFLSDQDDAWFPGKIDRLVAELAADQGLVLAQGDMALADERLRPTGEAQLANTLRLGLGSGMFVFGCSMAVRRDFLALALPVPEVENGHDAWLARLAIGLDARRLVEEPLQYYRRHGGNASTSAASTPGRLAQVRAVAADLAKDSTADWTREIACLEEAIRRLEAHGDAWERLGLPAGRTQRAVAGFRQQIIHHRQRLAIVRRPRPWRPVPIATHWLAGRYRSFSGWKSALRDFMHP